MSCQGDAQISSRGTRARSLHSMTTSRIESCHDSSGDTINDTPILTGLDVDHIHNVNSSQTLRSENGSDRGRDVEKGKDKERESDRGTAEMDLSKTEEGMLYEKDDLAKSQSYNLDGATMGGGDLPPLEGWKAWLMVFGGWWGLYCTFGFTNGFGTYQTYYQSRYPTAGPSTISLIGGVQVMMLYMGGILSGRCVDKFGPRVVVGTGTFLCTFGLMMLSLTTAIWQVFLTQGVLYGLGMACIFFPSISVPASWFSKNKAFAIGIVTAGSSVGGVIWPIMMDKLLLKVGFEWMTRISGFVIMFLCGLTTIILEPRTAPKGNLSIIPDFTQLRKPAFTVLLIGSSIGYFGLFGPIFYIQARAESLGLRPSLVPYVLSIMNASSFFGRILPGLVADRYGPMNTWAGANFFSTLFILTAWIPAHNEVGVIMTAITFGFSLGAWVSVLPACVPRVAGAENVASSMGLFYFMSWPGGLSGAALGGLFIHPDATNSAIGYRNAGILWGMCSGVATFFVICSRLIKNPKIFAKE